MLERLQHLVPRSGWLAPLLAAVLFAPALAVPFLADDWIFIAGLEGHEVVPPRSAWQLFHLDLGGGQYPGGVQGSLYQWWSSPDFAARFFRPLSSISHGIDTWVWGRNAVGHHLTSLVFYVGLVALVGALYRRVTSPAVALLAVLIFAIDDCHAWPVSWIANRNGLLGVLGAAGLLYGHHRWRQGGGGGWLLASLASYVAGLCAAEACMAGVGYVIAYELCLGEGPLWRRLRFAGPAVALATGYLLWWKLGGFGTVDSGLYLNPFDQPARFVGFALPTRVPLLLLAALTPVQVDMSFLLTDAQAWLAAGVSSVVVVALLGLLAPTLRRDPLARMFLLGALVSLLPISATFASGRNLLLPTLGLSYVLARAVVDGFTGQGSRGLAKLLVAFHLVLAPVGALLGIGTLAVLADIVNGESLDAEIPNEGVEDLRVAVLNTQSPMTGLYMGVMHAMQGKAVPAAIWPLVAAPVDQELVRTGPRTIRLRAAEPGYLTAPFELLTRKDHVVEQGEVWRSGGLTVRASEVIDGRMLAFEAEFDRDLDDPSMLLLAWNGTRLAKYRPPPIGGCVELPLPVSIPLLNRARRAAPADLCASAPGLSDSPCSLELLTSGTWTKRAELACPGPEGLGLVALGDVGLPGELLTASTEAMRTRCAVEPCHLMTLAGDLMYVPGDHAVPAWELIWDRALATLGLPGLAVLGNHEYRHEPNPAGKRAALYGADGRAGLMLPGPSWTARIVRDGQPLFAVVGLDTDSVANPGPDMPGLGEQALTDGCALGVTTIVVGHHPSSSQGRHHGHEAHVERALSAVLREASEGGCRVAVYLAGHDHDLQAWAPGCEVEGNVGTVVSGVAARGFRQGGSQHLSPCPASGVEGSYHAGLPGGGFAVVRVAVDAATEVRLYQGSGPNGPTLLSTQRW